MRVVEKRRVLGAIILAITVALVVSEGEAQSNEAPRPWALAQSIAVRNFPVLADGNGIAPSGDSGISFSPDGRYFAFIARFGDLTSDANVYDLYVYRTQDVRDRLAAGEPISPLRQVRRRNLNPEEYVHGIGPLHWEADGRVTFLGAEGNGVAVFRYDVEAGRLAMLSPVIEGINVSYRAAGSNGVVQRIVPLQSTPPRYPMTALRRLRDVADLQAPLNPSEVNSVYPGGSSLTGGYQTLVFAGRRQFQIEFLNGSSSSISPSGRYVAGSPVNAPGSLVVYDLSSRRPRIVARAPISALRELRLAWSASEQTLAVLNAIPTGSACANVAQPGNGQSMCATLLDLRTGQATLASARVQSDQSISSRYFMREIEFSVLTDGERGAPRLLVVDHHGDAPSPSSSISAVLREDANTPPQVFVSDGRREAALLPPDPALDGVWLSEQRPVQWLGPDGETIQGGLYLPRDFAPDRPVPLVVQAYSYYPDRFLPDGDNTTVDAAQLLAARGVAVLKYRMPNGDAAGSEGSEAVAHLDAAVDALAAQGFIDPNRVALTGFSRAGYQAFYVVTHPGRTRLRAAIVADAYDGTFSGAMVYSAFGQVDGGGGAYGSNSSFWAHRDHWLQHEPLFNVDRVRTPVMITNNGLAARVDPQLGAFWQTKRLQFVGAFNANRRPLEILEFPEGSHGLRRPREREAMLSATVDWLLFWLTGEENMQSPGAGLYPRWRTMREEWDAQQAWEASGNAIGSIPSEEFLNQRGPSAPSNRES